MCMQEPELKTLTIRYNIIIKQEVSCTFYILGALACLLCLLLNGRSNHSCRIFITDLSYEHRLHPVC